MCLTKSDCEETIMKGSQPVLFVSAETLPEAFTRTLKAVWENGCDIATEYDRPGDPPSKDATVMVEIKNPLAEPRFHMYGGPADMVELEIFWLEVVHGVHDHWVDRYGEAELKHCITGQ
jgi:thymidylate synthase